MITALDTSVILDVVVADQVFAAHSLSAIRSAAGEGKLIVCECVLAEITPALNPDDLEQLLADWRIEFAASSKKSAMLAGTMQKRYLQRAKDADRVLPDFLIGSHAFCHANRLLARDRGYYRDYFTGLVVVDPTPRK